MLVKVYHFHKNSSYQISLSKTRGNKSWNQYFQPRTLHAVPIGAEWRHSQQTSMHSARSLPLKCRASPSRCWRKGLSKLIRKQQQQSKSKANNRWSMAYQGKHEERHQSSQINSIVHTCFRANIYNSLHVCPKSCKTFNTSSKDRPEVLEISPLFLPPLNSPL